MSIHALDIPAAQQLAADIQHLELRASRLGLHVTRRGLNNAKNAIGWELTGEIVHAERAIFEKRPGEP